MRSRPSVPSRSVSAVGSSGWTNCIASAGPVISPARSAASSAAVTSIGPGRPRRASAARGGRARRRARAPRRRRAAACRAAGGSCRRSSAGSSTAAVVARWSPRSTVYSGLPRDRRATSVEHRAGEAPADALAQQLVDLARRRARRARAGGGRGTTMRSSSIGTDGAGPTGGDDGDRQVGAAADRHGERAGRRRVEPLQVVDGEQHRRIDDAIEREHVAQRGGDVRPGGGQSPARPRRGGEAMALALHLDQRRRADRPAATAGGSSSRPTAGPARPR